MKKPSHRRWTQIRIRVDESRQDELLPSLTPLGFSGFLQERDFVECYDDSHFVEQIHRRRAPCRPSNFSKEHKIPPVPWSRKTLQEKNWNRRWEAQTGIVEVTTRMIIKPSWAALRKKDKGKIVLRIDPKMSFGTGHHETTRLCLQLLERYLVSADNVLDLGTGTGVLAIAAAKLGARKVLALDNDVWSITNAKENIRRNRVERVVSARLAGVDQKNLLEYALVTANIDFVTINTFISSIESCVKPKGRLLISGILTEDAAALLKLFREHFHHLETIAEGEWSAFAFQRS